MGRRDRRGSVYLVVISTTMVVTTLALTGLALVRVEGKIAKATADVVDARRGAQSAVELGQAVMALDPNWRATAAGAGGVLCTMAMGGGSMQVSASDPVDGNLTNWEGDEVDVVGSYTGAGARQMFQMRLRPVPSPMSCLGHGVASVGEFKVTSGVVMGAARLVSNDGVVAQSARVLMPVEAASSVSGSAYESTAQSGRPSRKFPGASAFAKYVSAGTEIPLANVPSAVIERVVLSAATNPYATGINPRGIYWIDCRGGDVTLRNCRIVGTLVLLNVNTLTVSGSVNWTVGGTTMPALLCQGKAEFTLTRAPLVESALGTNFNPASTPYEGASNAATTEEYPSRIKGLVYVSGDSRIHGELAMEGEFILGAKLELTSGATLSVQRDPRYAANPPPGFQGSCPMSLVPGSFARVLE